MNKYGPSEWKLSDTAGPCPPVPVFTGAETHGDAPPPVGGPKKRPVYAMPAASFARSIHVLSCVVMKATMELTSDSGFSQ